MSWPGPRRWHTPATPCCWPRDARPWTCSPTTAHAATPSRRPCTGCGGPSRTDRRGRRGGLGERHQRGRPEARASATRHRWLDRPPASRRSAARWSGPLTSYYLLLGGSTMLLAIGLMMVLSASSVYSFQVHDSSYYIFLKQLTWVLIGLPGGLAGQPDEPAGAADARLAGRGRRRGAARADPDQPRLRGQRQPQLARPRPADRAALRDRQALHHPVGRRRLREEGEVPRQPRGRR